MPGRKRQPDSKGKMSEKESVKNRQDAGRFRSSKILNYQNISKSMLPALLIFTFAVYSNSMNNDFTYDDPLVTFQSSLTRGEVPWQVLFTADYFEMSFEASYRPMVTLTYMSDHFFWNFNPMGYHLTNILIHLANVVLGYYLLIRLFGFTTAAAGAALFGIHPGLTETVNAVAFREDSLCLMFSLGALLLLLKDRKKIEPLTVAGSSILFAAALLSKENALIMPVAAAATVWIMKGRKAFKKRIVEWFAWSGITIIFLIIRFVILGNPNRDPVFTYQMTPLQKILNAPVMILRMLETALMPVVLSADHEFTPYVSLLNIHVIVGWTVLIFMMVLLFKAGKKWKWPVAWFLITMLPVLNVYPLTQPIAERFLYMPFVGIAAAFGYIVSRYWMHRYVKFAVVIVLMLAASKTYVRNRDWKDNWTLFNAAYKYPHTYRTLTNLAPLLREQGRHEQSLALIRQAIKKSPHVAQLYSNLCLGLIRVGEFEEAAAAGEKALLLKPDYPATHHNLGYAYYKMGYMDKAVHALEKSLELDDKLVKSFMLLAEIYQKTGRHGKAVNYAYRALQLDPESLETHQSLADILIAQEKWQEAEKVIKNILSIDPQNAGMHYRLGTVYSARKENRAAIREYSTVISLVPAHIEARMRLGIELRRTGNLESALRELDTVRRIAPNDPRARFMLGSCLYESGSYKKGIEAMNHAISIDQNYLPALLEIALAYAFVPQENLKNIPKAIQQAEKAVMLTESKDWAVLIVKSKVMKAAGKAEQAKIAINKAESLKNEGGDTVAPGIDEVLPIYIRD